jgi:hypothetical protein
LLLASPGLVAAHDELGMEIVVEARARRLDAVN